MPRWAIPFASRVLFRLSATVVPGTLRSSASLTGSPPCAFIALLVSGIEIVISHPRFYWGETGNVLTQPLFILPIPSSRALVPTGYGYVLPDQNGWSRALHFQAAWILVLTGLLYLISGFFTGHFRKNLLPRRADLSWRVLSASIADHLRFKRPSEAEAWSYNVLQRLAYLFVIFVLFPLVIWTGLAMSLAFVSAFPVTVTLLGGQQSARTHSLLRLHVSRPVPAGPHRDGLLCRIQGRMRAMITGRAAQKIRSPHERSLAPQTDHDRDSPPRRA